MARAGLDAGGRVDDVAVGPGRPPADGQGGPEGAYGAVDAIRTPHTGYRLVGEEMGHQWCGDIYV